MAPDPITPLPLDYTPMKKPSRFLAWLRQPIGWPTYCAAAIVSLLNLWSHSGPLSYFLWALVGFFVGGLGLAVYYVFRLAAYPIANRSSPSSRENRLRSVWRWLPPPAMAICTIMLLCSDVPRQVTFNFSHNAMNRLAREAATYSGRIPNRRVGCYEATEIQAIPGGGVCFIVPGTGFLERGGWAYLPPGTPPMDPSFNASYYADDWYIIAADFYFCPPTTSTAPHSRATVP